MTDSLPLSLSCVLCPVSCSLDWSIRWEYYVMIYVRSALSIRVFPRASLALFLLYHFYLFSFPSGFHVLALLVLFLFLSYLMVVNVITFEKSAFIRVEVSIEQPRYVRPSLNRECSSFVLRCTVPIIEVIPGMSQPISEDLLLFTMD